MKTLSKRSAKPVDGGRLSCWGDIDEGPGVVEHSVNAGVAGALLAGAECLMISIANLLIVFGCCSEVLYPRGENEQLLEYPRWFSSFCPSSERRASSDFA